MFQKAKQHLLEVQNVPVEQRGPHYATVLEYAYKLVQYYAQMELVFD